MDKERIWELDALRGVSILGMVVIHLLYDLRMLWNIDLLQGGLPGLLLSYGGIVFVLLSGLCVTLGSRTLRRGLTVLGAGVVITFVTMLFDKSMVIRFGVLHLLGSCMILWPLFRRLPPWALTGLGVGFVLLGGVVASVTVAADWLFPLGLHTAAFRSADYFPLFPYLGWFLLLPQPGWDVAPIRFLCRCGRNSLWIYLLHQPVLLALCALWRR